VTLRTARRLAVPLLAALLVTVPAAALSPAAAAQPDPDPPEPPAPPQVPPTGARDDGTLQPGTPIDHATAGVDPLGCAVAYVLDGPGATYLAVPATCTSEGAAVSTPARGPVGETVHVADDVALVELDPEDEPAATGAVRGHEHAPTGTADPADTRPGDLVATPTGAGALTLHARDTVRANAGTDERPIGTPLVHEATGTLVGHVETVGICIVLPRPEPACGIPVTYMEGPTVPAVLDRLEDAGYDLELRTAAAEPGPAPGPAAARALAPATEAALDADGVVQPGDPVQSPAGYRYCTFDFVFDGPEHVYLGVAKHCVSEGDRVATRGLPTFGTAVATLDELDAALVQVDAAYEDRVVGHVEGHPGVPQGAATPDATARGDPVAVSGHGLGPHATEPTREQRWGLLEDHGRDYRSDRYRAVLPVVPGDSGGPVFHGPSGDALGIAARIHYCIDAFTEQNCSDVPVWIEGPTIEAVVDGFREQGYDLELRTAARDPMPVPGVPSGAPS
jgi:hypothetical protein